jgi:hypothetical protein
MSNTKIFKTPKGTELKLMTLKGNLYMQVAYRIQWFIEENPNYSVETNFIKVDEKECVAHTTVAIFDKEGKLLKRATGTKKETQKDFGDYIEKAETGSLGRALISLGYGTQYALADLDEGTRIVDSPIEHIKSTDGGATVVKPTFRKAAPKKEDVVAETVTETVVSSNGSAETAQAETGWE